MTFRAAPLLLALAAAGCSAVRSARDAQEAAVQKSRDGRAVPSVAMQDVGRLSSLPSCVAFALTNRPSVVSARLSVDDARLQLKQIAAGAPVVSATPWNALGLSASAGWSETSGELHARDLDGHTDGSPSAALSLEALLYDFGRNAAEARAQAERVIAAEQALIDEGYAVFKDVADATFACREKALLLDAAETNELSFLSRLQRVESQRSEGEAKSLDVLRARLDHARAREDLVAASNALRTAFSEFRHALGIPAAETYADERLRRALPRERLRFTAEDPVWLARTNAPSMRIARARLRAASADVDRAVADLYPTLTASASLSWADPLWVLSWGGRAAQSLFQGFRKTAAVDLATVALRQAEAEVDAVEQDLVRSLEQALATRGDALEAERAARDSLAAALENLEVVLGQSKIGEADRVELADAVNAVAEARAGIASAVCREQKAQAALFVLTGTQPVYESPSKEEK